VIDLLLLISSEHQLRRRAHPPGGLATTIPYPYPEEISISKQNRDARMLEPQNDVQEEAGFGWRKLSGIILPGEANPATRTG